MPNYCYEKKNLRVLSIINMLDDGKPRKTIDIANYFSVDARTVQRDLKNVVKLGYEIEYPQKGMVKFAEGVSMKKRFLTSEQQQGLNIFRVFAKTLDPELSKSCEALVKSFEQRDKGAEIIPLMPKRYNKGGGRFIDEIFEAIEFGHALRISYHATGSKKKEYEIKPFALVYSEGFVYVYSAPFSMPSQRRTYRVDRIKKLEHLYDKTFLPIKGIREKLKAHNIWGLSSKKSIEIKLHIDGWAVDYFKNFELFRGQKIEEATKDSIFLTGKISKFEEVIPQILRWIPCIKVLSPKDLSSQVKNMVRAYIQKCN